MKNRFLKKYINVLTKIKTFSEKGCNESKLEENKGDLRQEWKIISFSLPTNRKHATATSPCSLKINDRPIFAPQNIAKNLNEFFLTICPKLVNKIEISFEEKHISYLEDRISSSAFLDVPSMTEINNGVFSLNINKSVRHDQILPYFLRIASFIITPFLHIFAEYSFMNGIFPENCTIAKIISIFKKENRQNSTNYQPISILTYFSKVFEKLIHTRLIIFWTKHNVLISTQYGFQTKLSTTHAFLDEITSSFKNINDNLFTGLILLDLSKAFDTVCRDILLFKLKHYGIRRPAKDLMHLILKRKQFVFINSRKSSIVINNYGIAQGSTLGPLLFLINVNDRSTVIR